MLDLRHALVILVLGFAGHHDDAIAAVARRCAELARLATTAPSPGDRPSPTTMTLAELLDASWQAKRATFADSTAREHQRIIDTRLKPDLGAVHLDRLPRCDAGAAMTSN